jgi:hypothetical protein
MPTPRQRVGTTLLTIAAAALVVSGCGTHRTYPVGTSIEFQVRCVRTLWVGWTPPAEGLREAFCRCVLRRSQRHWSLAEFDQIRMALGAAGYRVHPNKETRGVPSRFVRIMNGCRKDLDRGWLPVE